MITLKELEYINSWASKAPYPGVKYAESVAEQLCDTFKEYEDNYKNKKYDLILSDGTEFIFEIMTKNVCHMLGIDYRNLTGPYFDRFRKEVLGVEGNLSSYDLLTAIINNIDAVIKYDYTYGNVLNYYRIMIKCSIFDKLSDFTKFNFGVINYNNTGEHLFNSDKFLYVESNERTCPYFMMGILQEESSYAVETLIAPTRPEDFFAGQTVCIPTQIMVINDTMNKYIATPEEKLALINQYKSLILKYNLTNNLDIFADYLANLSDKNNEMNKLSRKR